MFEWLSEPGFWAVVFLLWCVADKAAGAALARPAYVGLNRAAQDLLIEYHRDHLPETAGALAAVRRGLIFATAWYMPIIVGVIAPFYCVYISTRLGWLLVTGHRWNAAQALLGPEPSSEVDDLAFSALFRRSPTFGAWITLWCALPVALTLLFPRHAKMVIARRIVVSHAFIRIA
jgi:hypothetical protein